MTTVEQLRDELVAAGAAMPGRDGGVFNRTPEGEKLYRERTQLLREAKVVGDSIAKEHAKGDKMDTRKVEALLKRRRRIDRRWAELERLFARGQAKMDGRPPPNNRRSRSNMWSQ